MLKDGVQENFDHVHYNAITGANCYISTAVGIGFGL